MKNLNRIALGLFLILSSDYVTGQHNWTYNPSDYSSNGSVTAIVYLGEDPVITGTLGCFVGETCRGFADGIFIDPRAIFGVLCSSSTLGEVLHFRYYDSVNDTIYNVSDTIHFKPDMIRGSFLSPLEFHILINNAPVLDPIGNKTICQLSELAFTATATDPDAGDILTFSLAGAPVGASINGSSGAFSWTPAGTQSGSYTFKVKVSDNATPALSDDEEITVMVNPVNTSGAASSSPTLCISTPMTAITHATTGATGIGTPTNLPAGVNAAWAANTITISGTPSASGTFNYSIPLTGGCGTVNATGTITVTANKTAGIASSTPTLCINTPLSAITHSTTGATGIGTPVNLPAGVNAAWATNTITISGTPSASGTFNYSIPLTGGCGTAIATGTITVTANNTAGTASSTPTLCVSTPLTAITHTTTGATGIGTPVNLPAGVNAVWVSNTITISGTPTASGSFNYNIPLTGGCGTVNATGTITVTPNVTASVSISADPAGAICAGTMVTFTATPVNGGTNPDYQWKKNGTNIPGAKSVSYKTSGLADGDVITVQMISDATCVTGSPATSNTITMIVNTILPASVTVAPSANPVCAGTSVIFTATPVNGGLTPTYQWYKNAVAVGTNSPTYTVVPLTGESIYVVMTSGLLCASGSPATSNTVSVTLNPLLPASVGIAAVPAGTICAGTSVTFTATPVNGGASPTYQWKKNGSDISGATNSTYTTNTLVNGDNMTVVLTSNLTCASGSPATSNSIIMNVTPAAGTPTTPTPSGTTICQGSGPTSYTTSAANATSYNWSVSGTGNTITGTGTTATVTWAAAYYGTATISVTANGCNGESDDASTTVLVNQKPAAPLIGTITQTTCFNSAGSIQLNGLPTGDWTLTRYPGGISSPGNGISTTITGLLPDTYNFTVTNSSGCISASSLTATIDTQPVTPTAPVIGTITYPTCTLATGSVQLTGLPAGNWTLRRYPGPVTTVGNTPSVTISGLTANTYYFTVANESGCVSGLSENAILPLQPSTPTAPVVGTITQPDCAVATGSVVLNNLPSGDWIINPGDREGTGSGTTITGLAAGIHNFTVTNESGCTSPASANIMISTQPVTPSAPTVGTITPPTCSVATGSVVLGGLPAGTWTITRMPGGATTINSGASTTITGLPAGASYNFTVANSAGCTSAASENVNIIAQPESPDPPAQDINCSLGFGNAVVTVTSPIGTGLQYSLDGGAYSTSPVFNGVDNGNHYIAVRNSAGCTTTGLIFSISCGCNNPTTLLLSSNSGTTCGIAPVTVTGNTFGGSATSVTMTDDGGGTVNPASATTSPFTFTYTPVAADIGKVIIITVRTNNPLGTPCTFSEATYFLTVNAVPSEPAQGTIAQPNCLVSTGSIAVTGLPSGTWTLSRIPGGVTIGSGTSTIISGLDPGAYTFTVTNAAGCTSPSSAVMTINSQPPTPTAPVIGTVTQPSCITSTGSVALSGLPSSGNWTVTRTPGGVSKAGNGTTTTISNVPPGTFTFTVTNSNSCISVSSEEVIINPQPATPSAPSVGTITPPTCTQATGSVVLLGLPSTGSWTLTRYIGAIITEGDGTTATISGLPSGTYNYTVTNSSGCVSVLSANVVIPAQPATPAAPVTGAITQPTSSVPTGSVVLSGLPAGNWVITRLPGAVTTTGTGANFTITGLPAGVFTFTVANAAGCISQASTEVIISTPGAPDLFITDPAAACGNTVDITAASITAGSTPGLTYTYWKDATATIPYDTPAVATDGIYYIKGTTVSGYYDIQPVVVTVDEMPVPNAGQDQTVDYKFNTLLDAGLTGDETGIWSLVSGTANFDNNKDPKAKVSNLSLGRNILLWTVTSGVCPSVSDQVIITVSDLKIPTLITPNGDSKNEKFVLRGVETLGKTELLIFDRRGARVYKNMDYDNSWNGTDYNGNDLPEDTYFYIIKSANGKSLSGYIVIRR